MATKKRIVYGAQTEWSFDEGAAWDDIPECTAIAIPEDSVEYKDATHLQSPGRRREFIPGLIESGDISLPCNYTSGCYATAHAAMLAGTLVHFRTTMPVEQGQSSGDVFTFQGYVVPKLEGGKSEDDLNLSLEVKPSGDCTFAEGAAA